MKKAVMVIIVVIVVAIVSFAIYYFFSNKRISVIPTISNKDIIVVVSPLKDSKISSPLSVAGRAKGLWFFEGSFPLILVDKDGKIVAEGHASAQGDLKTDEFVKFVGNIQFDQVVSGEKGTLVLKKGDISDSTQNQEVYEVPIIFK